MSASAAVDARALAREGQKTQWAPTRNFSSLNARAVFGGESRGVASPYAGEEWETAAGEKDYSYAANSPVRFVDLDGRKIVIVGDSPGFPSQDLARLRDLLDRVRQDPCAKELVDYLENLPQNIIVDLGQKGRGGGTSVGYVVGNPRNSPIVRMYFDPDFIGESNPIVPDVQRFVHEIVPCDVRDYVHRRPSCYGDIR